MGEMVLVVVVGARGGEKWQGEKGERERRGTEREREREDGGRRSGVEGRGEGKGRLQKRKLSEQTANASKTTIVSR